MRGLFPIASDKMMPGINPKMMKRMGIKHKDIPAKEVIIRLDDKELVIKNPRVAEVNMMGQKIFQVIGIEEERSLDTKPEISKDDIKTVMEQAKCSEKKAKEAIEKANGDLAQAIMDLSK